MRKKRQKAQGPAGKPALDLIEEAMQLLRVAPVAVHLYYYIGAIPFVLALLYFWSDMAHGAYAYDRITASSLELALLFVWMKCFQAVSASKLRAFLMDAPEAPWTAGRIARMAATQAALQPFSLLARPLALIVAMPYAWIYAFFENLVVVGDGTPAGIGEASRSAARLASLWGRQSWYLRLFLFFFTRLVWANVVVLMVALPHLLKMFTGVETVFTRSPWVAIGNTTFLAVSFGITYLCANPVSKAIFLLRCFYGESIHSGGDLKLGMRKAVLATAAAVFMAMACIQPAHAEDAVPATAPAAQPPASSVNKGELNDTIERVLKRDEFAWRLPRQTEPSSQQNFVVRYLNEMTSWVRRTFTNMMDRIRNFFHPRDTPVESSHSGDSSIGSALPAIMKTVLWAVCILVLALLGWLIWTSRHSLRRRNVVAAQGITAAPDLASEEVIASQLPEDEWLAMARDMIARGELRLAARAFYLATLAHLGLRELIFIARHKSNREYQTELRRRARAQQELLSAFGENLSIFEGAWYGDHAVTDEQLGRFSANMERIRTS